MGFAVQVVADKVGQDLQHHLAGAEDGRDSSEAVAVGPVVLPMDLPPVPHASDNVAEMLEDDGFSISSEAVS